MLLQVMHIMVMPLASINSLGRGKPSFTYMWCKLYGSRAIVVLWYVPKNGQCMEPHHLPLLTFQKLDGYLDDQQRILLLDRAQETEASKQYAEASHRGLTFSKRPEQRKLLLYSTIFKLIWLNPKRIWAPMLESHCTDFIPHQCR